MTRRLWLLLALVYTLGCWTGTLLAADCVAITVRPRVMLVSSDVDVQVRVARHSDHGGLSVAWESDVGAGGSRWFDLDGEHAPVLYQWWTRHQPAAAYVFLARVVNARGDELGRALAEIRSVEREGR